jgi:hypothetical protein
MKNPNDGITERPANYYTLSGTEQKRIDKALKKAAKKTGNDPGYWDRPVHVIETPGGLNLLFDSGETDQSIIAPYLEHGYTVSVTTKTLGGKVFTFTKAAS